MGGRASKARGRALVEPQPVAGPQARSSGAWSRAARGGRRPVGGHQWSRREHAGQPRAVQPSPSRQPREQWRRDAMVSRGPGQPAEADLLEERHQAVLIEAKAAALSGK